MPKTMKGMGSFSQALGYWDRGNKEGFSPQKKVVLKDKRGPRWRMNSLILKSTLSCW